MPKWRDAVGFEGFYQVSDNGRVRRSAPAQSTKPGKILKPGISNRGRLRVSLSINSKCKTVEIAKLVAEAFLGPIPQGKQINHIDYDCTNNRVSNLEYVTGSENVRHAYANGFIGGMGENQHLAKLTEQDVKLIRKSPLGATALAAHYGVARRTITEVRQRRTWKHVK